MQGFWQSFIFRLCPRYSKFVDSSELPSTLFIDIIFNIIVWEDSRGLHELLHVEALVLYARCDKAPLDARIGAKLALLLSSLYLRPSSFLFANIFTTGFPTSRGSIGPATTDARCFAMHKIMAVFRKSAFAQLQLHFL